MARSARRKSIKEKHMRRFFTETTPIVGESFTLSGEEARHILTVLRMKCGDEVLLVSGDGTEYSACIESCARDRVVLKVTAEEQCMAEPATEVTLFQCLPKSGKTETIVQKCVELGIHDIQLVSSKRCVVKPDAKDNKLIRYNRVAQEASKQSGRGISPEVKAPKALQSCDFSGFDLLIVAYENEQELSLRTLLREKITEKPQRVGIFIGPEGGLEMAEVEFLLAANKNAYSVSLGRRILRTETAGMAMLAMLMYELEA